MLAWETPFENPFSTLLSPHLGVERLGEMLRCFPQGLYHLTISQATNQGSKNLVSKAGFRKRCNGRMHGQRETKRCQKWHLGFWVMNGPMHPWKHVGPCMVVYAYNSRNRRIVAGGLPGQKVSENVISKKQARHGGTQMKS
jgi:hypothetical protein